jgi:hypothetical protein
MDGDDLDEEHVTWQHGICHRCEYGLHNQMMHVLISAVSTPCAQHMYRTERVSFAA